MEEVQVIDCPPTPEILLSSSTTPPRPSLLDMLDSSSSAEELDNCSGDAGIDETESGRSSPPPKCAICLGKCRQKCYTDSCRHQFCYRCLLEWSKIKAECPLCKQVFRSIIYKQKSYGHYQEHKISIAPPASPGQGSGSSGGGAARTVPQVYHRLDFTLSQPPRFTYSATLHVQPSQSERLRQLFLHQSGDVQRFSREFPDDSIPSRQNGPEWRRYIYHRRLHARPLADISGRMRDCSASFYRENPAQIHRLMPWINRELVALCRNNPAQVSIIMEDFPNLLMSHDITSPAFRERVSYWGRVRTAHFIHELLNFARSPYDIIGYDRSVQYDPYYNNNVVVLSSSSSSSSGSGLSASEGEDDVVRIVEPTPGTSGTMDSGGGPSGSARRGRTQFTIETRSSDQTVIMTGSFGGAGVSGIVSVSTSGTQPNNGAATSTSIYPDLPRMQPLTSMLLQPPPVSRFEDGENISLSSSDSDDCRIVGALKPPHLRTPEMVSLESESDSDVVFVNEDATRARSQPMDSNSVLEQLFPETLLNQELAKLENHMFTSEYNNGASTSSGGGSASGGIKKYYAKPRLNRYSDGTGFKSIYEASESEKSHGEPSIKTDSDSSSHDEVKFNIRNQPTIANRKRKVVKRRQASSCASSTSTSRDDSSTSDSESESSSSSSSGCSSSSSSSAKDIDNSANNSLKFSHKQRSRRSKVRSSRRPSKRPQNESKSKTSKAKKRKTSSSKRSARKRQKLEILKAPLKSSPESGKGTSVSCTCGPSAENIYTTNNAAPLTNPTSSSSGKKRKVRSAVVKLNPVSNAARQQLPSSKRRRKAPICSELITSTDFSSEENKPEPNEQQMPPAQQQEVQHESTDSSSVDTDTSDSEEGRCTIASLIRAAKTSDTMEMKQQSTSSSSCSSSSKSSSSANSSLTEPSGQLGVVPDEADDDNDDDEEEQEDEEDDDDDNDQEDEETNDDEHNESPVVSTSDEVDVSVAQVIAVGAEVEL